MTEFQTHYMAAMAERHPFSDMVGKGVFTFFCPFGNTKLSQFSCIARFGRVSTHILHHQRHKPEWVSTWRRQGPVYKASETVQGWLSQKQVEYKCSEQLLSIPCIIIWPRTNTFFSQSRQTIEKCRKSSTRKYARVRPSDRVATMPIRPRRITRTSHRFRLIEVWFLI